MPEGFIRLEGGGHEEQFSGKSIRPKHKHRHASNPSLSLCSILFASSLYFSFPLSFPQSRPAFFFLGGGGCQLQLPCSVCYSLCLPIYTWVFVFLSSSISPLFLLFAESVSEAQQSLITGKRTHRRKQTAQGGNFLSFCSENVSLNMLRRAPWNLEHRCCGENNKHTQIHCKKLSAFCVFFNT